GSRDRRQFAGYGGRPASVISLTRELPAAARGCGAPGRRLGLSSVDTRALRSQRFRLYLTAQIVSLSGTAIQQVGLAWLMYRLSGSSALVGTTVLLTQLPILLLSPIAGVLADRFDRGILLLATQAAGALQALALALAAATQLLSISALLGLSLLLGLVNSVDVPA